MKYLIVNGDDFGASSGINRGIMEAHTKGILTSASLMVNLPFAETAAALSRGAPELSVGLHVDLESAGTAFTPNAHEGLRTELQSQLDRFRELINGLPTHLDSHHNLHRNPELLPGFVEFAQEFSLPLRENSVVRNFPSFYGRWAGESHPEQISVENLMQMLAKEIEVGFTELSCHPGYVDPEFATGYSGEREIELRTLCDPRVRDALEKERIELIGYHNFAKRVTNSKHDGKHLNARPHE